MNNTNKNVTGVVLSAIGVYIVLIDRVAAFITFSAQKNAVSATLSLLSIIMASAALWYGIKGFKKPHGNSLRFIYFMNAVYLALHSSVDLADKGYVVAGYSMLLAALTSAYVSGRLHKIEKNKKLIIFSSVLLLIDMCIHLVLKGDYSLTRIISLATPLIIFGAISYSYIQRYEMHKNAGLED